MSFSKIDSIRHMMHLAVSESGDKCAFRYKIGRKDVIDVTFREFYDECRFLGAGLCALGLDTGHIACAAKNSYRWITAYMSRLQSAGVFVPVDKDLPEKDLINVLNVSDSIAVFYDSVVEDVLKANVHKLPDIKYFICLDKEIDDGRFISYDSVISLGKSTGTKVFDERINPDKDALKLLVFTSGTTGASKGVMLTENNLIAEVNHGLEVCRPLTVGLSVLPYCHTYGCVVDILSSIHCRCTMCINTSLKRVLSDFKLYKPDYVIIVPLFAEMFLNGIQRNIKKQGKEKEFRYIVLISKFLRKVGIDIRRKVFTSILDEFGGNLKLLICGGAVIRKEIGEFFDTIGITLIGGYGITECSPLVSVNSFSDNSFDSVGHRIKCVEWKINEPDDNGEGEIYLKGDNIMKGYYRDPERTHDSFDGEWFKTGDYGRITCDDKLIITGRKKNLIVLANGKNIFPEEIENYIMTLPYVSEVIVKAEINEYGEETGLIAEIYCEEADHPQLPEVEKDISEALRDLPPYKRINKVILRENEFAKTTSKKIVRA